jgi:hypothetical protein
VCLQDATCVVWDHSILPWRHDVYCAGPARRAVSHSRRYSEEHWSLLRPSNTRKRKEKIIKKEKREKKKAGTHD